MAGERSTVTFEASEPSAAIADRESSRDQIAPAQRQLFLAVLPAALFDAHELSVLAAPLRTSRR